MNKKLLMAICAVYFSVLTWAADISQAQKELQLIVDAAEAAVAQNQWRDAKKRWDLALQKVAAVAGDDEYLAVLYYEQGRSAGVLCQWDEAEISLQKALTLDKKTDGPFFMSLLELARLQLAQKNLQQAKEFYDQLLPELKANEAAVIDPIGSAEIVSEYAQVLVKLGAVEAAKPYREMADTWRNKHQGIEAETSKTPYGSLCQFIEGK